MSHAHHKHALFVGVAGSNARGAVLYAYWCEVCGATRIGRTTPRDDRNWRLPVNEPSAASAGPFGVGVLARSAEAKP